MIKKMLMSCQNHNFFRVSLGVTITEGHLTSDLHYFNNDSQVASVFFINLITLE